MRKILAAFEAVGTSRPVELTLAQKQELLGVITAWASEADGGQGELPHGIRLRTALFDAA